MPVPFHEIREESRRGSPSVVIIAAAAAAVVPAEGVGCTQDAESVEEVLVFGAAEGHVVVAAAAAAGIAVPSHRDALSH